MGARHTSATTRRVAQALQRIGRDAERLANRLSGHDPGLATWLEADGFERATDQALADAVGAHTTVSVLAVVVDHLDLLISNHGSPVGREIMDEACTRIRTSLRQSDRLAPLGDNALTLLWVSPRPEAGLEALANRVLNCFDQPFDTSAGSLTISANIGIATLTGPTDDGPAATTLRRQAQTAALSAQRGGRGQVAHFDQSIQTLTAENYETERLLRTAIQDRKLSVDYQPIVSLHSGAVIAVEALARWQHQPSCFISPTTFIPIAEQAGLIYQLGSIVIDDVFRQSEQWLRDDHHDIDMVVVNLSYRQLLDKDLIPTVTGLLETSPLSPRQLCFEIKESMVMNDVTTSTARLGRLKDLGLSLAIDDFGSGSSSLSHLRKLPVDILKLDQSFVRSIYNRGDRAITKAVIDLAHTLGMITAAKGVETGLQVEALRALGCDMAQGFALHHPTPAVDVDFSPFDFVRDFSESLGLPSAPAASEVTSVLQ